MRATRSVRRAGLWLAPSLCLLCAVFCLSFRFCGASGVLGVSEYGVLRLCADAQRRTGLVLMVHICPRSCACSEYLVEDVGCYAGEGLLMGFAVFPKPSVEAVPPTLREDACVGELI